MKKVKIRFYSNYHKSYYHYRICPKFNDTGYRVFSGKEPDDNSDTCTDKIFETEEAAINHYVNLVNGLINKRLASDMTLTINEE